MCAQFNSGSNINPRFNVAAQEVLRTSTTSSIKPGNPNMSQFHRQLPMQGGMPQMPFNFSSPTHGFNYIPGPNGIPMPHASGWQVQNLQNLLAIKKLQDEINDEQTEEEKDAYFDNLLAMLDKQRDVLTKFVDTLSKSKADLEKNHMKDLDKQARLLEKENILKQIKINDEQAQLYRNLNAPYDFDPDPYKLSDSSDSEDDDDILLEILSNKVYFKKIQSLLKKKKKKRPIIKKVKANPTYPDESMMSGRPMPLSQSGYMGPMGGQYSNPPSKRGKSSKKKNLDETEDE